MSSSKPAQPHLHVDTTTNGGQLNQACAACKHQRRKCEPDCPLARYFPGDQQRRFLNAHRVFGLKNIQRTLRQIHPEYAPEAMYTLIYESEARAADPVHGCVRIIKELERQIHVAAAVIKAVHHQIDIYRQAEAAGVQEEEEHCCSDDARVKNESPTTTLGAPFVDVKPQALLPVAMAQHSDGIVQPPERKVPTVVKCQVDADHKMAAQCHLELGFNSRPW